MNISADKLKWFGRNLDYQNVRYFDYSSSGFCFILKGKQAFTKIISNPEDWDDEHNGIIGVYISKGADTSWESLPSEPTYRYELNKKVNDCLLFESDTEQTVTIWVIKLSEAAFGYAGFSELQIEGELLNDANNDVIFSTNKKNPLKIEFVGDSITCGYGIEGVWSMETHFSTQTERADKSYAFLTAKNLNAEFQCCSWSGIGIISNYVDPATVNLPDTHWLMPPLFPYTDKNLSLTLGLEPEIWNEKRFSPDIIVVHLGTNDISWVREVEERRLNFVSCYRQFLEVIHQRSPKAKICCCLGVMGTALNDSVSEAVSLFNKDFPSVKTKIVTFSEQDEKDGIAIDWHPSAKTHQKISEKLTKELKNF